jgi:hypothetical protein
VRTARYRLDITTRRNGAWLEEDQEDPYLADLALDPREEVNRAADPAYAEVLADLRSQIGAHIAGSREPAFVPTFSAAARGVN